VSGSRIFTLDVPARITVRPALFSVGYRSATSRRYAPYVGAGVGWHSLKEESPAVPGAELTAKAKLGYHVLGGMEFPLGRWTAVAGEVQWATVPDALGETGVSAVFDEDDLGGTTFRFKFLVGF
jgi:opacity protein-like surface antigen